MFVGRRDLRGLIVPGSSGSWPAETTPPARSLLDHRWGFGQRVALHYRPRRFDCQPPRSLRSDEPLQDLECARQGGHRTRWLGAVPVRSDDASQTAAKQVAGQPANRAAGVGQQRIGVDLKQDILLGQPR